MCGIIDLQQRGDFGMSEKSHRPHLAACPEVPMRFSVTILGREVLTIELGAPDADDEDVWVDCGSTTSTPVGFVRPEIPWDVDGPVHQFDPDE